MSLSHSQPSHLLVLSPWPATSQKERRSNMEYIGLIVLWIGIAFCAAGVLGIVRMPDLYCRLHASGKVATVGLCGLLLGAVLMMPVMGFKALALAIFAILTLPVSTHAIAAAAHRH